MSNYYLDIIKDRLNCDGKNTCPTQCANSDLSNLNSIVRLIAPYWLSHQNEYGRLCRIKKKITPNIMLNDMAF
jgi:isoleucyl-tRNA synthetase